MENSSTSQPRSGQGLVSSRGRGRGRGLISAISPGQTSAILPPIPIPAPDVDAKGSDLHPTTVSFVKERPSLPTRCIGRGRGVKSTGLLSHPVGPTILVKPEDNFSFFRPINLPMSGSPDGEVITSCLQPLPIASGNLCPTSLTQFSDGVSSITLEEPKPDKIKHVVSEDGDKFSNPVQSGTGTGTTLPILKKGKKGKPLLVTSNYIRLAVQKFKGYFEYHVEFVPNIPAFSLRKQMLWIHRDHFGPARSFDGTFLYLPMELPKKETTFRSTHPHNSSEEIVIKIKFVTRHGMANSVHFYNLLFRHFMKILGMVQMGRNCFDPLKTYAVPQHRLEIWPGMVTAVDEYEGGLMLTCDSSFRVLSRVTLLDLLNEIRQSCPTPQKYREMFLEAVLNKIVLTRYNNKSYRIDDVAWEQTPLSSFNKGTKTVTFESYYQNHHKIQIQDMAQPLLISRPKRIDINRKESRDTTNSKYQLQHSNKTEVICLIPELCYNTGLSEEVRNSFGTMKDISSYTRLSPNKRYLSLQYFIENIKSNAEITSILNMWGLEMEDGTINLEARAITGPNIEINPSCILKQAPADFSKEVMTSSIVNPVTVKKWAVMCLPQDLEKASRFVAVYRQVTVPLGIQVASDAQIIKIPGMGRKLGDEFRKAIVSYLDSHVQFLVIILPSKRQEVYGSIKRLTLTENVVPTQMILSATLTSEKKIRAIVTKIALQLNCKLGGFLWSLQIPLAERIMFVGMDVYHDPKNFRARASCTAMIATMNGQHTKFFSRVILQRARQETGDSLGSCFSQALAAFLDENHAFPDRVVVFRDGVGDGQLELVREHEVAQFLNVLDYMMEKRPKFTFTVIQKRINTRIFVENNDCVSGRDNSSNQRGHGSRQNYKTNPLPGTVLDHTVTRKYLFDFFLVSQFVREGTVTPTHYIVVDDNCSISPDLIQKFAYATTFMYFNWPGTIRVPAVCQYAHKLAYLVGEHLEGVPSEKLAQSLYFL